MIRSFYLPLEGLFKLTSSQNCNVTQELRARALKSNCPGFKFWLFHALLVYKLRLGEGWRLGGDREFTTLFLIPRESSIMLCA